MTAIISLIWKRIKQFGEAIAKVVNFLLLTIVYASGIFLTWAVAKLFMKHFLDLGIDSKAKSYWKPTETSDYSKKESYRSY